MAKNVFARGGLHELQILLYVCSLLKVTRPHIDNPLLYAAKASKKNCAKIILKAKRLSLRSFHEKIKPQGAECDLNSVVLINPRTAVYLSARNCQWVSARFYVRDKNDPLSFSHTRNATKRWIVLLVSAGIPDDVCLVSPILYHNIKHDNDVEISVEFTNEFQYFMSSAFQKVLALWHNSNSSSSSVKESVKYHSPHFAVEVHVKFVESLKYKCGNAIELLINDYFALPKTVTLNDIIVISVPSHLSYEFTNNNCIVPPKYVFIQVCSVRGKTGVETQQTMLVTKDVTKLYLSGTTKCSLPCLDTSSHLDHEVELPPVLASGFKKLKDILEMEKKDKYQKMLGTDGNSFICTSCKGGESINSVNSIEIGTEDRSTPEMMDDFDIRKDFAKTASSILFLGPPGNGIKEIINLVASDLGIDVLWIESWHLKGDTSGTTEARVRQTFLRAATQGPCILVLENVHALAKDHDGNDDGRVIAALRQEQSRLHESKVVLVATAPSRSKVSADLWSIWSHQETVEIPNLKQRSLMLDWLFSSFVPKPKIQVLAQRTAGYMFGDFQALYTAAQRLCIHRLFSKEEEIDDNLFISKAIPPVEYEDLLEALDELQSNRSEALGAPRIPQVRWKEVGGLEDAKREVVNTIQLPLRHPSLVSSGLRRSGVLLYGPPGTGKTLLAKAVATECGLNFMSVKGPELLNMYVGQSEENVRQVFSRAKAAAPCVIFFDELDSLAPNRGRSGDSGGVMDRIVSALLAELDGVANTSDVFVMAATNRPDLIDPALLRPGRFEKLVSLGVCEDRAGQIKILKAITSKVPLAKDVDLEHVAEDLPLTLTGADLYALCIDALYIALYRCTEGINLGKVKEEEAEILVGEEDFKAASEQLVPSVTPRELIHYRNLNTNNR